MTSSELLTTVCGEICVQNSSVYRTNTVRLYNLYTTPFPLSSSVNQIRFSPWQMADDRPLMATCQPVIGRVVRRSSIFDAPNLGYSAPQTEFVWELRH